jgi:hypothetical protein
MRVVGEGGGRFKRSSENQYSHDDITERIRRINFKMRFSGEGLERPET